MPRTPGSNIGGNRSLKNRFGTEAYAAEELVAELGAAFLCAELWISQKPRKDYACYIENWLKVPRNDKRAIFTAASKATEAASYRYKHLVPNSRRSARTRSG